jgi:SAM-dependent methyltransferase
MHLFLSSSDNSSPKSNRRRYFALARAVGEAEAGPGQEPRPSREAVDYGLLVATPKQVEEAARYAIEVARYYVGDLPGGLEGLRGRSVLELGPGTSFASTLLLRCLGAARVAVCDRFLSPFRESFHVPIYRRALELLATEFPGADPGPLERCIRYARYDDADIECIHAALEDFVSLSREPFDVTVSNAVLEHLYHPLRAMRGLANVMKPGAIGIHQVDFRDHRDFDRPLEYLLLDEFSFVELLAAMNGGCGNRIRPRQLSAIIERAGFEVQKFQPVKQASPEYLAGFLPRLRACAESAYCQLPEDDLRVTGGKFILRRP